MLPVRHFNRDTSVLCEHYELLHSIPVAATVFTAEYGRGVHWLSPAVHSQRARLTGADLFLPAAIKCFN